MYEREHQTITEQHDNEGRHEDLSRLYTPMIFILIPTVFGLSMGDPLDRSSVKQKKKKKCIHVHPNLVIL
jgi:hypothetical protein